MRPPPPPPSLPALAQAGPWQSDSLLGLLALATKICRLAVDIETIDRVSSRGVARSPRFRSSCNPQAPTSGSPLAFDLLCPRVSAGSLHSSSSRTRPVTLYRQRGAILAQSAATQSHSSLSFSLTQRRHASMATASTEQVDVQVKHHAYQQPHFYQFPSAAHLAWRPSQDALARLKPNRTESGSFPSHWVAPWTKYELCNADDKSLNRLFEGAISEQRADFAPGYRERSDVNGITRRRLAGHRLWHLYRQHAHKEALSLATRVWIAKSLVINAHLVTTNKETSPQSKALRFLLAQRIKAISQDCQKMLENAQADSSSHTSPSSQHYSSLDLALLQPIALALEAQPISALKLMDDILIRCRPDIYRYKTDHEHVADHLLSINVTLHTIMDSLNFEIRGRFASATLVQSIRSHPEFFEDDTGLLNDLVQQRTQLYESDHPIRASLEWFMASPHAFLLSHTSVRFFRDSRALFLYCVSQVDDPHELLEELSQDHDAQEPAFVEACDLLLRSVLVNRGSEAALLLYDDLWSRDVPISDNLTSRIIKEGRGQSVAARMQALIDRVHRRSATKGPGSSKSPRLLRAIARRWAMRNRWDLLPKTLIYLKSRASKGHDVFLRLIEMELAATQGDMQTLYEKLAEKHDFEARKHEDCKDGKKLLDGKAYGLLIKACNRSDDVDLAEFYLTEALERGITPRSSDFNLLIDLHVRRTNIDAALAIFEQMKEFGVQPDKYTYTILIHGFSLRRDPESAAHALRAMISAGTTPDRITYAAVLNCYVESGLYDAAIRLFAWMRDHQDVRLRPTIEVCNIILKAYVLSSMPVQKVMQLVGRVREMGLHPNANTYALMLQSACDAGLMDLAEEVFSEAERALPSLSRTIPGQGANVYHFTIMIHGYLRLGEHAEAKDYFDEMRSRELAPSSITWNIMVHSYAHSENEANYDLACTLVSQLVADESKKAFRPSTLSIPTRSKKSKGPEGLSAKHSPPFEILYTTLMVAQARRGEPEKVENTLKQMSRDSPALSVYTMTPLLDAYRRAGDVESALELFEQIYEVAVEAASSRSHRVYAYSQPKRDDDGAENDAEVASEVPTAAKPRQDANSRNLLCLPVSIMIDLLSTAGRHEEIAKIWAKAKNDGFGFDSDNWNHLAASMARAGQLEEALSVVEHVLYHDPPSAWMRARVGVEGRKLSRATKKSDEEQSEGDADDYLALGRRGDAEEVAQVDAPRQDGNKAFDPLPSDIELDPAIGHRSDAASAPSNPPGRRDQARPDDDPYIELPFDRPEPLLSFDGEDGEVEEMPPPRSTADADEEFVEPSAYYIDSTPTSRSLTRDLSTSLAERFSPWYAHFGTLEAISQGLADMRENRKVIQLLDKYKTAASLLDLHERKVEIIRERQKEEAVRSARDLIDGRS